MLRTSLVGGLGWLERGLVGARGALRGIMVKMEPTPNPDSMKFIPEGEIVLPESMGSGMVGASPPTCGSPGSMPALPDTTPSPVSFPTHSLNWVWAC